MTTGKKKQPQQNKGSQTLARGLDVIEAVAQKESPTIAVIAGRTGMTYSTTHRIVSLLIQRRYVKHVPSKGYCLGSKLLHLGFQAYAEINLSVIARPYLEELSAQTDDTVHLACEEMGKVLYLDKIDGHRPVVISSRIGGLKPMTSTGVGKALLLDGALTSWSEAYDKEAKGQPQAILRQEWLSKMRQYAQMGYAFDLGEDEPSIFCVAAPIRDANKKIIAAISISSTNFNMPRKRMQEAAPLVTSVAHKISIELGY